MKNTKGFTLIELLAVIVILAIIALIVTPVVSDIILSARIAANARSVEGHVRNIELAIISEAFNAETGDLTQYDVTEGALKTTLTLPNNDTVECAKYTILNGTVMRAWDCKPKTGSKITNWNRLYNYENDKGAYSTENISVTSNTSNNETPSNTNNDTSASNLTSCKTFSIDSWSTIKTNVAIDSSHYAVGCEKEVKIDMNEDGEKESYTVRIANTSTPSVCETSGYSQTACGVVIEFVDILESRRMNPTNTNAGGWAATEMVTYLNSDFYNKLPSDLQSAIIPTYPIVSGSGSGGVSPNITEEDTTKNKIYLLSGREVGHTLGWDNKKDETTDTRILDYYTPFTRNEEAGRIKKDLAGNATFWWLRSPFSRYPSGFYGVSVTGSSFWTGSSNLSDYRGVAPAFRIQ